MGTLPQKVACRLLVAYIEKAVTVYVQARKITYATPKHAAVEKYATVEIVMKQTRQRYAKHFHELEIKIMSSFRVMKPGSKQLFFYIKFYYCSE